MESGSDGLIYFAELAVDILVVENIDEVVVRRADNGIFERDYTCRFYAGRLYAVLRPDVVGYFSRRQSESLQSGHGCHDFCC